MNLKDTNDYLKSFCTYEPLSWDNSGIQIGDDNDKVKNILICIDVTNDVVEYAKQFCFDTIISHHPLLFNNLARIDGKILKLINNDINVISVHTNYDSYRSDLLQNIILPNADSLPLLKMEDKKFGSQTLKPEKINILLDNIKNCCNFKPKMYLPRRKDGRFAFVNGSANSDDVIDAVLLNKIDTFVCGEINYHNRLLLSELNINVIELGHPESEYFFLDDIKGILDKEYNNFFIDTMMG